MQHNLLRSLRQAISVKSFLPNRSFIKSFTTRGLFDSMVFSQTWVKLNVQYIYVEHNMSCHDETSLGHIIWWVLRGFWNDIERKILCKTSLIAHGPTAKVYARFYFACRVSCFLALIILAWIVDVHITRKSMFRLLISNTVCHVMNTNYQRKIWFWTTCKMTVYLHFS